MVKNACMTLASLIEAEGVSTKIVATVMNCECVGVLFRGICLTDAPQ